MTTFDELVRQAQQSTDHAALRPVVEKELLHHEILRAMAGAGLLHRLTFIGGTCLRACYGSNRLSEDLDFTGGSDFTTADLRDLGKTVTTAVKDTFDLDLQVSEPKRVREDPTHGGKVATWKFSILTNPGSKHLPQQRIHIDICAVASHQREARVLRNHYGIDLGTAGLILQAESRTEILADKIVALALRANRIKHRDIWDICWLLQQNERLDTELVLEKCDERHVPRTAFIDLLRERTSSLDNLQRPFIQEMRRFLPAAVRTTSIDQPGFWNYACTTVRECIAPLVQGTGNSDSLPFRL